MLDSFWAICLFDEFPAKGHYDEEMLGGHLHVRDWCMFYRFFCREKYFAAGGRTTVTFYGGAEQVGGSCAIVENGGTRILVDCGTFYGDDE